MSRCLFLHGNAEVERGMAPDFQRRKPPTKAARTGKPIDDAESGWQMSNLSNSDRWLYTRSASRSQDTNDRRCQ